MKKFSFLVAALLVAMAGCQKEPQAQPENDSATNAEAVGYVSLKISLPSTSGTKADTDFEDGTADEYKVNDVTVVFYDADGKYVYHTAVSTKPWDKNGTETDDITVTGKTEAIKIEENADKIAKALVLINSGNFYTTYEDNFAPQAIGAVANVKALTGEDGDSFFMSNAPYYKDGKFETLVDVKVADNEHSALDQAASVKVERAAAKVTVNASYGGVMDAWMIEDATESYEASFISWGLSVTNKSFYLVRNGYDKTITDWFKASGDPINEGLLGSRIYMAVDPNYDAVYTSPSEDDFYFITKDTEFELESDEYTYCPENTFCIESMRENQTTTAIMKVRITPNRTGSSTDKTWFQVGTGKMVYTIDEFAEYMVGKVKEVDGITITEEDILALDFIAGECGAIAVTGTTKTLGDYVGPLNCYKDGYCYYPVKIRHFDDETLGYDAVDGFKETFTANGYMYQPSDLGRYGVLRNTWYKINVHGVSAPGSSTIPEPGDILDDKYEQYVACSIDVLAWSVREQNVIL